MAFAKLIFKRRSGGMVDAHGLEPCEVTHGGSTPLFGTKQK